MRTNPFRALPDHVEVNGRQVPIDPSFRVGVAIELEVLKEEKPDVAGLLSLFYRGSVPADVKAAVDAMLGFFRGYNQADGEPKQGDKKRGGRVYDFEQDAEAISSSFLTYYNIDLTKTDLHWWEFRRLLFNLPHESNFMQRIMYRTADLNKLDRTRRKHFKKMREIYAIKDTVDRKKHMTVEERDAELLAQINRRYQEAEEYVKQKGKGD